MSRPVLRRPASEAPVFRTQMLQQQFTGPVEPPAGGSPPAGDPPAGVTPPAPPVAPPADDKAAPAQTAEQLLAAYNGLTPEQVVEMATELETSRRAKMSADQKAVEDAATKARADADAAWKPKLLAAQLSSAAAGTGLTGDRLKEFVATANPTAFTGADGEIDAAKVTAHVKTMFGEQRVPPHRNWGQHGSATPPASNQDLGSAEADRRFGPPKKEK